MPDVNIVDKYLVTWGIYRVLGKSLYIWMMSIVCRREKKLKIRQ